MLFNLDNLEISQAVSEYTERKGMTVTLSDLEFRVYDNNGDEIDYAEIQCQGEFVTRAPTAKPVVVEMITKKK